MQRSNPDDTPSSALNLFNERDSTTNELDGLLAIPPRGDSVPIDPRQIIDFTAQPPANHENWEDFSQQSHLFRTPRTNVDDGLVAPSLSFDARQNLPEELVFNPDGWRPSLPQPSVFGNNRPVEPYFSLGSQQHVSGHLPFFWLDETQPAPNPWNAQTSFNTPTPQDLATITPLGGVGAGYWPPSAPFIQPPNQNVEYGEPASKKRRTLSKGKPIEVDLLVRGLPKHEIHAIDRAGKIKPGLDNGIVIGEAPGVSGGTESIFASLEKGNECPQVRLTTTTRRMQQHDLFKSSPTVVLYGIFDVARKHLMEEGVSYDELGSKEKEKVVGRLGRPLRVVIRTHLQLSGVAPWIKLTDADQSLLRRIMKKTSKLYPYSVELLDDIDASNSLPLATCEIIKRFMDRTVSTTSQFPCQDMSPGDWQAYFEYTLQNPVYSPWEWRFGSMCRDALSQTGLCVFNEHRDATIPTANDVLTILEIKQRMQCERGYMMGLWVSDIDKFARFYKVRGPTLSERKEFDSVLAHEAGGAVCGGDAGGRAHMLPSSIHRSVKESGVEEFMAHCVYVGVGEPWYHLMDKDGASLYLSAMAREIDWHVYPRQLISR